MGSKLRQHLARNIQPHHMVFVGQCLCREQRPLQVGRYARMRARWAPAGSMIRTLRWDSVFAACSNWRCCQSGCVAESVQCLVSQSSPPFACVDGSPCSQHLLAQRYIVQICTFQPRHGTRVSIGSASAWNGMRRQHIPRLQNTVPCRRYALCWPV